MFNRIQKSVESKVTTVIGTNIKAKVQTHLVENKRVYIALGVGVGIGLVAARQSPDVVVKFQGVFIKSPVTNIVVNAPVRRIHPGYLVQVKETGEIFASKRRASAVLGVSLSKLDDLVTVLGDAGA